MNTRGLYVWIVAALFALPLSAEVPQLVSYQGYLTDDVGYPTTDPALDMAFSIWDDATDTDPSHQLWTETWDTGTSPVSVYDGYCTVLLGSYQPFGTLFEDHDDLWLEIEVDGSLLTPRKRIAASAYNQRSKVAGSVPWTGIMGMPAGFADGTDDVGLMTETDPTVLASVKDGVSWTEIASIPAGFADGIDDVGLTAETDPTVPAILKDGVDFTELSGTATDAQIPNDITTTWNNISGMPAGFSDNTDDTGAVGTAIEPGMLPYTISTPGYYYFTKSLNSTGVTPITITADYVTLDLRGFSLLGAIGSVEVGIYINGARNVEIRNGTVEGFGSAGIYGGNNSERNRVLGVRAVKNNSSGIYLSGNFGQVTGCTISENGSTGVRVMEGSAVTDCLVHQNGNKGIDAANGSTITGNTCFGNANSGITGYWGMTISNNTVRQNGKSGIAVLGASLIQSNAVTYNQEYGIDPGVSSTLINNAARENNQSGGSFTDIGDCSTCLDERGIAITSLPFTISTPGVYYLVGNLTSTGTTAITVAADDVTLELNGFTLTGTGISGECGIYSNNRQNIEIRNGTIRDFGADGLYLDHGHGHRVIAVRAINNLGHGIRVSGRGSFITDCYAQENSYTGIYGGSGRSTITNNIVIENGMSGISCGYASVLRRNLVFQNQCIGISCSGHCVVISNVAYDNDQAGIGCDNIIELSTNVVVDNVAP